jgi:hypothetical protein
MDDGCVANKPNYVARWISCTPNEATDDNLPVRLNCKCSNRLSATETGVERCARVAVHVHHMKIESERVSRHRASLTRGIHPV